MAHSIHSSNLKSVIKATVPISVPHCRGMPKHPVSLGCKSAQSKCNESPVDRGMVLLCNGVSKHSTRITVHTRVRGWFSMSDIRCLLSRWCWEIAVKFRRWAEYPYTRSVCGRVVASCSHNLVDRIAWQDTLSSYASDLQWWLSLSGQPLWRWLPENELLSSIPDMSAERICFRVIRIKFGCSSSHVPSDRSSIEANGGGGDCTALEALNFFLQSFASPNLLIRLFPGPLVTSALELLR